MDSGMIAERNEVLEPHGGPAATIGVENLGAAEQQSVIHLRHTRYTLDIDFAITEADNSVPLNSAVVPIDLSGPPVNYIRITPSARGNAVYLCVGGSAPRWAYLDGLFYPVADEHSPDGAGSIMVQFPTRRNWRGCLVVFPQIFAPTYTDAARIVYGYLPDVLERVVRL